MNIIEAVKLSLKHGHGIRRNISAHERVTLYPIGTASHFIVQITESKTVNTSAYWRPTVGDMLADDWEVVAHAHI